MPLSPEERSIRARIGAYSMHARHGGHEITAAARAGFLAKFIRQVEEQTPGLLDEEKLRRAELLLRAYMAKLALRSARARRERREAGR